MLESVQMADERRAQMFRQLNNQKTMLIEHATVPNNCNTWTQQSYYTYIARKMLRVLVLAGAEVHVDQFVLNADLL
jgi:hypothetical protein